MEKANYGLLLSVTVLLCIVFVGAGSSWANGRFVDNSDGTVTDTKTGLMWQKTDGGTHGKWADEAAYYESFPLGNHNDWRAPRIDELESIINYAVYKPAGFDPPFVTLSSNY